MTRRGDVQCGRGIGVLLRMGLPPTIACVRICVCQFGKKRQEQQFAAWPRCIELTPAPVGEQKQQIKYADFIVIIEILWTPHRICTGAPCE